MIFLSRQIVCGIHADVSKRLGVRSHLRDEGLLKSSLSRVKNLSTYRQLDVFAHAGGYMYGMAKFMPFASCNKQVALICAITFLRLNGQELRAKPEEAAAFVLAVAAGEIDETGAAMFFRDYCVAVEGTR